MRAGYWVVAYALDGEGNQVGNANPMSAIFEKKTDARVKCNQIGHDKKRRGVPITGRARNGFTYRGGDGRLWQMEVQKVDGD
jgi:hypothetical protein